MLNDAGLSRKTLLKVLNNVQHIATIFPILFGLLSLKLLLIGDKNSEIINFSIIDYDLK